VPEFDAVLFDLDGTLCEPIQSETEIYEGAFQHADIPLVGTPGDLWSALEGAPDPQDEHGYLAAGFERVLAEYGREGADADALAAGFVATVDYGAVRFLPGAEEALRAASANGPVGLVTNGPEHRQAPKVETLDLESRMDTLVYAGDMPRRKPQADPFERATETLGVDPGRTLYVGNSIEFDVAGAHAAGLPAAWLRGDDADDPGEANDAQEPEFVLSGMADLTEVLNGG
jgi:putative hydrolase of the HAD superfamily